MGRHALCVGMPAFAVFSPTTAQNWIKPSTKLERAWEVVVNNADKGFLAALIAVFTFISGMALGWRAAHEEVSIECLRQGSFYVGDKDFTCSLLEKAK